MRASAPDRRKIPRVGIAAPELSVLAFPVAVRLLDISLSGVLLEATHPVELGMRGTLHFNFGGVPFSADVKVERSSAARTPSGGACFSVGATFVALSRQDQRVIARMIGSGEHGAIDVQGLAAEMRVHDTVASSPGRERRRTVSDDLYSRLTEQRESFWSTVYPMYMAREITRANVRDVVRRGLEEARGNYRIVARNFNMESRDYKRFLNFLRKHDCQLPFKEYR